MKLTLLLFSSTQTTQMEITVFNHKYIRGIVLAPLAFLATNSVVNAQDVEQVRWKSESQVEAILGEPQSKTSPVGTHASYTLWQYEGFTVAFANNRAFHLFKNNSLNKMALDENRPES